MFYYITLYIILLRFIQYNPTSLERNYKHDVLTEVDLGVPIDLILPETYANKDDTGEILFLMQIVLLICSIIYMYNKILLFFSLSFLGILDPADEALLEEEVIPQPESKRSVLLIMRLILAKLSKIVVM